MKVFASEHHDRITILGRPVEYARLRWLARVASEISWVGIGQVAAALGGIGSLFLLTRQLSMQSFGELCFAIAVAAVAQGFFSCLSNGMLRFLPVAVESAQTVSFNRATRALVLRGTVVHIVLIVLLSTVLVATGFSRWAEFVIATGVLALLAGYYCILESMLSALRQRAAVALHRGALPWLRAAFVLGIVWIWGDASNRAVTGFAIATGISVTTQLVLFRRACRAASTKAPQVGKSDSQWRSKILIYILPFSAWFLFGTAQLYADRWALRLFASPDELGLYTAIYQIGFSPMILLAGFTAQLMGPVWFKRAGDGSDSNRLRQTLTQNRLTVLFIVLFGMAVVGLSAIFHGPIARVILPPSYWHVSVYLPVLMAAGCLFAAGHAASFGSLISTRTHALIVPRIATAVVAIALTFCGAHLWGLQGVVYAAPISCLVHLLAMLYANKTLASAASS